MLIELLEKKKNIDVYKQLLQVLGAYADTFPATQVNRIFDQVLSNGIKSLPKEEKALHILHGVLWDRKHSVASRVQKLLNLRFSDLPSECQPTYKDGNRKHVAYWEKDGKTSDRVMALINVDGASNGHWSDAHGQTVKLIDTTTEEK